jgi:mono/diheme cytochrome c family protein
VKPLIIALMLGFVTVATVVGFGLYDVAADRPHWNSTKWLLETARDRAIARRAQDIIVPQLKPMDNQTLIEAVVGFANMCVGCHTPPGGSPNALALGLNPPAPDLVDAARRRPTTELFWITKHGIRMTGMPAWSVTHSDKELWSLVNLILKFPEFGETEYMELLETGRASGIEHHHNHDHNHDHSDHGHN